MAKKPLGGISRTIATGPAFEMPTESIDLPEQTVAKLNSLILEQARANLAIKRPEFRAATQVVRELLGPGEDCTVFSTVTGTSGFERTDGEEQAMLLAQAKAEDIETFNTYTPEQKAAARAWKAVASETREANRESVVANLPPAISNKPSWNAETKALSVGGSVVAEYRKNPAPNQTRVLTAFEECGWPDRIDDPLPGPWDTPEKRLNDTVRAMNEKQGVIHFRTDGTGQGVIWERV